MADDPQHQLKVERKGGLAGFGGPGSRLRSVGSVDLRTLSPGDRQAIDALFAGAAAEPTPGGPVQADAFQYHLTLETSAGERTVVVPEHKVPACVRDAVQDQM
jgi:hypothetical protein